MSQKAVSRPETQVPSPVRELMALKTEMLPKPASRTQSLASTTVKDRQALKGDHTSPRGRTVDAPGFTKTPPSTVRDLGEQHLEPAKAEDDDGVPVATVIDDTLESLARRQSLRSLSQDTWTHDATISPDLSLSSPSRRASGHVSPGGSSEADDENSARVLSLISDTQCDILASVVVAVRHSTREVTGPPDVPSRVAHTAVQCEQFEDHVATDSATDGISPTAFSSRSEELRDAGADINALPANTMFLLSPGEDGAGIDTTTGDHSYSPIDSAGRSMSPVDQDSPPARARLDSLESLAFLAKRAEFSGEIETAALDPEAETKEEGFPKDSAKGPHEGVGKDSDKESQRSPSAKSPPDEDGLRRRPGSKDPIH